MEIVKVSQKMFSTGCFRVYNGDPQDPGSTEKEEWKDNNDYTQYQSPSLENQV